MRLCYIWKDLEWFPFPIVTMFRKRSSEPFARFNVHAEEAEASEWAGRESWYTVKRFIIIRCQFKVLPGSRVSGWEDCLQTGKLVVIFFSRVSQL